MKLYTRQPGTSGVARPLPEHEIVVVVDDQGREQYRIDIRDGRLQVSTGFQNEAHQLAVVPIAGNVVGIVSPDD